MINKKTFFAVLASVALLGATSCTTSSTAQEDSLYSPNAIDRTTIKVPTNG